MAELNQDFQQRLDQAVAKVSGKDTRGIGERALGGLLYGLELTERPLHGIAEGIRQGLSDDPRDTLAGGFKKGLMGEADTDIGDLLGIPRPKSEDDWPDWLLHAGGHFVANIPADPLTYLATPAKAGGVIGKQLLRLGIPEGKSLIGAGLGKAGGNALMNYLGGTGWWRNLAREAPNTPQYARLNELGRLSKREFAPYEAQQTVLGADKALSEAFPNATREQLFHAIERPEEFVDMAKAGEIYQPVLTGEEQALNRYGDLVEYFGGARPEKAAMKTGEVFVPHVSKRAGEWQATGREIKQFVDTESGDVVHIGKLSDDRTKKLLEATGDGFYNFHDPMTGDIRIVEAAPANLEQTLQVAGNVSRKGLNLEFEKDPLRAGYVAMRGYQKKSQLLDFMKRAEQEGFLQRAEGDFEPLKGFESIKAPGERIPTEFLADPVVARDLEKKFGQLHTPGLGVGGPGPLGTVARGLDYLMNDTKAGQRFQTGTDTFKRWVLGHPGFVAGNTISDLSLEFLGATTPGWNLPKRFAQARFLKNTETPIAESGVTLREFTEEMKRHDLMRGMFSDVGRDYLRGDPEKLTSVFLKKLKVPDAVANAAQTTANWGGKYNESFLKAATYMEDGQKLGNALDYFTAHAKEFAQGSPEEKARIFANAAHAGHTAKLDYHNLPPFAARVMTRIFPFYNFQSGIVSRIGKAAINDTAKLRRLDEIYGDVMTPLDKKDREIADPWIREDAPITGLFGKSFDDMAKWAGLPPVEGKRMGLAGRFLPFTAPFKLAGGESPFGLVNPLLKAPYELLANKNEFKNRPIDSVAGGALRGLINPLIPGNQNYESARGQTLGKTLPAAWDYLLSVSPASHHLMEANRLGSMAGVLPQDPYKQPTNVPETALWWLTGGKTYPFDPARYQLNRTREAKKEETAIKSGLRYAMQKGDQQAMSHYMALWVNHQQQQGRKAGFVEGGL